MSTSMGVGLLGSVEKEEQEKMKCAGACGLVAQCDEYISEVRSLLYFLNIYLPSEPIKPIR